MDITKNVDIDLEIITDEEEFSNFIKPHLIEFPIQKTHLDENFFVKIANWIYQSYYEIMKQNWKQSIIK